MSSGGRPPAVRRFLWAPVVWPVLAVAVFGGLFVFQDLPWSRPHQIDAAEESAVVGTAVEQDREVKVRYRHPVTDQVVAAPLHVWDSRYLAEPGEEVRLVVQHDDPLAVQVEGDRFPLATNAGVYGLWIFAASLPAVGRRLGLRRAERLAAGSDPTFAMTGALFRSGPLGRCHLHLFALDAPPGAQPLCSARVLTTAKAPLAERTFPVEVKGSPRPLGRFVAQTGGIVLWPAGRAVARRRGRRGQGRPATTGGPPTGLQPAGRPAVPWRGSRLPFFQAAAGATAASLALFGMALAVTLRNAGRSGEISENGTPVVGQVVGHEGDDDVVVLEYQRDGAHTTRAPVDFASDYPVGIRYPVRLDPADPRRARLVTEPYDVTEPLVWTALLPAAAACWLVHRWRLWRRNRRVAAVGPWWHADGQWVGHDSGGPLLALTARGEIVAGVRVSGLPARPPDRVPLVVAGDVDPGDPVALWLDGTKPLTPTGAVLVPELPWQ